jgi:cytoskeletal protein RodZ
MLGIARRASQEDIRKAFDLCKHTYRDDSLATYSLFSADESKEIFSLMAQAYEILNDPSSRLEYDNYLSQKEGRSRKDNEGARMVASMIGVGKESKTGTRAHLRKAEAADSLTSTKTKKTAPRRAKSVEMDEGSESDDRVKNMLESVDTITGAVLKKIRTMLGVSLEDLSERTKIRKTYLQYLEDEEYEFLPAPVYIKGFVTNVATCLGLPTKRAADEYMEAYRSQQDGN